MTATVFPRCLPVNTNVLNVCLDKYFLSLFDTAMLKMLRSLLKLGFQSEYIYFYSVMQRDN